MFSRRSFLRNTAALSAMVFTGEYFTGLPAFAEPKKKPGRERLRVIIETDAGGDPDDEQSLVRFLVNSNEFDIEGIIANRPAARERENLNGVRTGLGIVKAEVEAYGKCYPLLKTHDPDFPDPERLLAITVPGYDDTDEGVNLIIRAVDAADLRPLWFCNWGTDNGSAVSCLKRALDKILSDRGKDGYAKFKNRIMLSSYDKFGDHTGAIEPPFQIWIDTFHPIFDGKRWYHRFSPMASTAGGFNIEKDVLTNHGPLGPLYPMNTNFKQKEGDTMTFLYFLPHGLSDPMHPEWGSWGGRYGPNTDFPGKNYFWANAEDTWNGTTHRDNTLARWAVAFQNDFKARMDWCVKPYNEANHHPVARVKGFNTSGIIQMNVRPGKRIGLDAGNSFDPDGRKLSFEWFIYPEAGTCKKPVSLDTTTGSETGLLVPDALAEETIHIILAVTNNGEPPLTSYRRIILKIKS